MTTKILALTDGLGNLVRFELLPEHRFDTVSIPTLLDGVGFGGPIADKGSTAMRSSPTSMRGASRSSSPSTTQRATPLPLDQDLYKW